MRIYAKKLNGMEIKRDFHLKKLIAITENVVKRYQDENGVVFMNIYEFLLDENSLRV